MRRPYHGLLSTNYPASPCPHGAVFGDAKHNTPEEGAASGKLD